MLNNRYYYFSITRKMHTIFASIFNDIVIERTDETGNTTQIINVPISWGQKDKILTRSLSDPNIDRQDAVTLPRMSFFLDGYEYDASRQFATANKYIMNNNPITFQYTPVPYNFHYSLWIYVKNYEDATKIVEQILPFFTPTFTVNAILVDGAPPVAIPVQLMQITHDDTDDEKFADKQVLIWRLNFTINGNFYGPIQGLGATIAANGSSIGGNGLTGAGTVINMVDIQLFDSSSFPVIAHANNQAFGLSSKINISANTGNAVMADLITFTPGLDANGNPTNNSAITIPRANIAYTDNYGLIVTNTGKE